MPDTGAPWNIPYIEPTDLVRDYPAANEAMAEAIAAALPLEIARTGTDTSRIEVGDDGAVNVADDTSPTPVLRPLPFAVATGTGTSSGSADTTVTFPAGRFTLLPVIMHGAFNAGDRVTRIGTVSASSFAVSVIDINTTARVAAPFAFLALQLTP